MTSRAAHLWASRLTHGKPYVRSIIYSLTSSARLNASLPACSTSFGRSAKARVTTWSAQSGASPTKQELNGSGSLKPQEGADGEVESQTRLGWAAQAVQRRQAPVLLRLRRLGNRRQ